MKVLVTGATGFIGSRILNELSICGWSAIGTSRTGSGNTLAADITQPESLHRLFSDAKFDAVINCAGIAHRFGPVPEEEFERVNVRGAEQVARLSAEYGVRDLIHLSSVLVYGRGGSAVIDETAPCDPSDPYASSKLRGEQAAADVVSASDTALTILRIAPVIGEGCKGNVARLIRAIDRGLFVNVGRGETRKSLVYVGDVAEACIAILRQKPSPGTGTFNLTGEPTTTGALVEMVYRSMGKRPPRLFLPAPLISSVLYPLARVSPLGVVRTASRSLETWLSDAEYSGDLLEKKFGFAASTPVVESVSRTVRAYLDSKRR